MSHFANLLRSPFPRVGQALPALVQGKEVSGEVVTKSKLLWQFQRLNRMRPGSQIADSASK
jgi:hypothetical protein